MTQPDSSRTHEVHEPMQDLPPHDTDARTAERVRKVALAAFVAERDLAARPWWTTTAVRIGRIVTPIFLAGTVGAYLTWAIGVAVSLHN